MEQTIIPITAQAARRNPWVRGRLFREFVMETIRLPRRGSGGLSKRDLVDAFNNAYEAGLSDNSANAILTSMVKEKRLRRIDKGRYASVDDRTGYPADFREFVAAYGARQEDEFRLRDAVAAFKQAHRGCGVNLMNNGAIRMARQAERDGVLKKIPGRNSVYQHTSRFGAS